MSDLNLLSSTDSATGWDEDGFLAVDRHSLNMCPSRKDAIGQTSTVVGRVAARSQELCSLVGLQNASRKKNSKIED